MAEFPEEDDSTVSQSQRRTKKLTVAGRAMYEENVNNRYASLSKIRRKMDSEIEYYLQSKNKEKISVLVKENLVTLSKKYKQEAQEFIDYLRRIGTEESEKERLSFELILSTLEMRIEKTVEELNNVISTSDYLLPSDAYSESTTTKSSKSSTSKRSSKKSHSSNSTIILRQRAKAEALKAKLEFTEKEIQLKRQKSKLEEEEQKRRAEVTRKSVDLETDLELLCAQKEKAVVDAELQAMVEFDEINSQLDTELDTIDSTEKTRKYIDDVFKYNNETTTDCEPRNQDNIIPTTTTEISQGEMFPQQPKVHRKTVTEIPDDSEQRHVSTEKHEPTSESSQFSQLANYILKKDLMLSRITSFDDKPEHYQTWKSSFKSVSQDLKLSPPEELDLLIRWLGPTSTNHAKSIRTSTLHNPVEGVKKLWSRLDERYGSPEMVETSLKTRLYKFPKITDSDVRKLYELSDLLSEIMCLKGNAKYHDLLSYFDTSVGVKPIVAKLPSNLQSKWVTRASKFKQTNDVPFPPFHVLCDFVSEAATTLNDPSLTCEKYDTWKPNQTPNRKVNVKKTDFTASPNCPIHNAPHTLNQCRNFRKKPLRERKQILRDNNFCYKCCESTAHVYKTCDANVKCLECGSERHNTAMHTTPKYHQAHQGTAPRLDGGEPLGASVRFDNRGHDINNKCTTVCGDNFSGRSCAKTVLVNVYHESDPNRTLTMYAIIDDQSNCTLARSELFDYMHISKSDTHQYTLTSCAGRQQMSGRRTSGFFVSSIDGSVTMELPMVTECNDIPDDRSEIPTPDVIRHQPHLRDVPIPALNPDAQILLLIGRDLAEAHHVKDQRIGARNTPFAQQLNLGWVVVGDVCLERFHKPNITTYKTTIIDSHRETIFKPCSNVFQLKSNISEFEIQNNIFHVQTDDNETGLSLDDREFMELMDKSFQKDQDGRWKAPLPFRNPRQSLPNNRCQALKRAEMLHANLQKNPTKKEHLVTFMKNLIESDAMEIAPTLDPKKECWYLPLFGVYNPKKPNKIRGVFDSSVKFQGVSLNSVLLSGPKFVNDLTGILLRFRKDTVGIMANIEQMFYRFLVTEDHRDFLRFFWYRNSDPNEELIEYRMKVHVFGNTPSPAVAMYGLQKTVENADDDVKSYVYRNFYVDDGITSVPNSSEAVKLLKKTQSVLYEEGKIRLHKIASNSLDVIIHFPMEDLEKNLNSIDIGTDDLPMQQSLGIAWDLNNDCFTFNANFQDKPFTKRGVLSIVNSIFDPLGFIAPIVIHGRLLMQEFCKVTSNWDQPLPSDKEHLWLQWKESLNSLSDFYVPRMFTKISLSESKSCEVHIYSDASEKAISAVAYLYAVDEQDNINVGFIMGKSKVAPSSGHTIPRLELCGAVLATELSEKITNNLDLPSNSVKFFTDSKVVLGYLNNRSRRFYNYVSNRVSIIHQRSKSEQWNYVSTGNNPADIGTRPGKSVKEVMEKWISGPNKPNIILDEDFTLIEPDSDKEIKPVVKKTSVQQFIADRFVKFSTWHSLVCAFRLLRRRCLHKKDKDQTFPKESVEESHETELFILRSSQRLSFKEEITCLKDSTPLPRKSALIQLNPFLDKDGILRVGGRLSQSPLPINQKHPIIIDRKSHAAILLVRHYHEKVQHQGRVFTEGALRSHGFWIIGAKKIINSVLHKCVICRKLRRPSSQQIMADLPADRVVPSPPFTIVGVDVFGPWNIVARRTRGGLAHSKRWAVLFSCLTSRAIHIEVIEELSSSAFINALTRFISIRGAVKEFRSDRGTNFVGALDHINVDVIYVESGPVKKFLSTNGAKWTFNPPHASHMAGSWERMIGIARKILDALLLNTKTKELTHEVLCTFMCEVTAIMNSRPICPISTDPENPVIISPSMLLTQKDFSVDLMRVDFHNIKDMYISQWKHVQYLSNMFWKRWRDEYLQNLQVRRKWQNNQHDLKTGDVVLMRDPTVHRGQWPLGLITRVYPSQNDGKVRTVEIRVIRDGKRVTFVRPITELVLLID